MGLTERNRAPAQLKHKTAEFDTDLVIFHNGIYNPGEGMMIQVVDGNIGPDGRHPAVYLDFGTNHGQGTHSS